MRGRTVRWAAAAGVLALALAGCAAHQTPAMQFTPSPVATNVEGPGGGVHIAPIDPSPNTGSGATGNGGTGGGGTGGGATSGAPGTANGGPSSSSPAGGHRSIDPLVVATHLVTPVGLSLLPDGTALVGERTTGRIVRVAPKAGRPVPTVRVLRGLDTGGGGGLLDLAVSPSYDQDQLIYAYVSTRTDNRVVDFTLHGPVTPVLTGIPHGRSGNAGRIAFGRDGDLYIATGDAGRPALARDPHSLAGKILRVTDIGTPAEGNPRRSSPVYADGVTSAPGLCASADSDGVDTVDGDGTVRPVLQGADEDASAPRLAQLPTGDADAGGCALLHGRVWVTSLDAQAVLSSTPSTAGGIVRYGRFAPFLVRRYGRLRTVVAAADGALWLTTSNRDGHGHPVPADERVIRWVPGSGAPASNPY